MPQGPQSPHHLHHALGESCSRGAAELDEELEALDLDATEFYAPEISGSAPNNLAPYTTTDGTATCQDAASRGGECFTVFSSEDGLTSSRKRLRKKTFDKSWAGHFSSPDDAKAIAGMQPVAGNLALVNSFHVDLPNLPKVQRFSRMNRIPKFKSSFLIPLARRSGSEMMMRKSEFCSPM